MNSKELHNKGLDLSRKGMYDMALQEYNRAIDFDPENPELYSDRAVTKLHLKDLDGALQDIDRSLKLDDQNPYRYSSRAFIREQLGDIEGARLDYQKSIELDPENAITQNSLGMLEEKLGYQGLAQKRFKLADELALEIDSSKSIPPTDNQSKVVNELLEELNIEVTEESNKKSSLLSQMTMIFRSKEHFNDYLKFIKGIFKKR